MKKIISSIVLSHLLLTGTVLAAPLTDFEKGKFSVDIGTLRQKLALEATYDDYPEDKKWGFDLGITAGLNDNMALQYKHQKYDTSLFYENFRGKFDELNLLYSLTPNTYAFVGAHKASFHHAYYHYYYDQSREGKIAAQIGVTSVAKIANKFDGWATVAFGADNFSYEIGTGYPLANNADLNLFYRYKKFKNLTDYPFLGNEPFSITTKGLGAGVTIKF